MEQTEEEERRIRTEDGGGSSKPACYDKTPDCRHSAPVSYGLFDL